MARRLKEDDDSDRGPVFPKRRLCKCGPDRLGVYSVIKSVRVGKPTAWGHVVTKKEQSHRCVDCRLPVDGAWKEALNGQAFDRDWRPVVGHPQFEHLRKAGHFTIRIAETKDVIGFLVQDPKFQLCASADLQHWETLPDKARALAYLLFIHETPL